MGIMEEKEPKVSRSYRRYIRKLSKLKYDMDKAQRKFEIKEAFSRTFI